MLVWLVVAVIAVLVAVVADPRWVVAPLAGYVIYKVGTGMLANLAADAGASPPPPRRLDDPRERTVYACEMCGTEVVLVVRGEEGAPRHCGERMRGRTEIPRGEAS
jgi:DNA-directed RNA polymerase subunit RPC12/RpoP